MRVNEPLEATGWVLTSFGSGSLWRPALARLACQVKEFSEIERFVRIDDHSLLSFSPLLANHSEFIASNQRGYGYWIWKPFLLLSLMNLYPDSKGFIYVDAGCEFNPTPSSRKRFTDYCEMATSHGALAFELPFSVADWTHPMLIKRMELQGKELGNQIAGGIIFLKNTLENRNLLMDWISLMIESDYTYLTGDIPDSPMEFFPSTWQEHRHDQSILSLLWKVRGLPTIPDETFWHPDWKNSGRHYPIWATRSKLRLSISAPPFILFPYRIMRKALILLSSKRFTI